MQKKLIIYGDDFFIIEKAQEKHYSEDDIMLSAVVDGKKYFLYQEPYEEPISEEFSINEIIHMFKHFSDSANFVETIVDDLGYEYFVYQAEMLRDSHSRDLYEFGYTLAFGGNIAVLFYKKANKMYCQITQNDWDKGAYKSLCIAEITPETLNEWKKKLAETFS